MKTLYIVSLGCPKNLVDSEVMLAALEQSGYAVVDDPDQASVLLINTCGFIRPAVEEAIDTIFELAAYKEQNPHQKLVVTGCMVQRYGSELLNELPEVDLFVGLDDFPRIGTMLEQLPLRPQCIVTSGPSTFLMNNTLPRRISTPFFRAYLKITEGCDNRCAYCMIPSIRGRLRSRAMTDLLLEATRLQQAGVRELALIAQDLTAYGRDLGNGTSLVSLLEALLTQTDIPWLRLLYAYPSGITDDLLHLMADQPRLLPYLDIPFQHVSTPVLRAMNRHYDHRALQDLILRIRRIVPDCAIRTTMLVGFPGETRDDVDLLLEALQTWQLDHVGVFQYQDEEGSRAAKLPDKISEEKKEARYQQVMAVQATISAQRQQRFVGRVEPVLVEGISEESDLLLEGRSRFQAPEIDGCVYITAGHVTPGDIVPVRITEAHTYDLVGEVVSGEDSR
ncbi:SSU ribosomal protein S12P methylthiotransferase [Desulfobulbus propionicus DSM 2032]|uniref:Ribosomal protein uS12 methylthiotransferase RimO n=1 Tax=Desulfobulbus propionicus (strain ATCC 33891 / DSM 2032 / VKM B-1956 / 1pr3) TaxID=577650 RepID=A0A7U3YPD7_DESPD|nr:30S ribosomal protein S12 methylthiotransferase RimO [Desulfobulbus propionicus]ADW19097.1 SSU ribosomal protein S12P methylthiotransferase [Desulfobulbus propionicus DSM 2032]